MSESKGIIKKWVPKPLVVPILIIAMFPHLLLLTMFTTNSTFSASYLDMDVDDLQFLFSVAYAMIVCGLFLHIRFFNALNVRNFLLVMTLLNIFILLGMSFTTNRQILLVLRFFQGPLTVFEGCIVLPILIMQLKSVHAKYIGYCVLYTYMLTSDKIATTILKFAIENYNFNMLIYTVICLHAVALLVYIFIFNQNRVFPKKPLYQLQLPAVLLMAISLISGAFFLVYGKRYGWLDSPYIVAAIVSCIVFSILFILHQKTSKRPLFHFEILKSKRIIAGLCMFIGFYMLRAAMSNVYQVMLNIWSWHWEYVLQIQYINAAGVIVGMLCSYFAFTRNMAARFHFALGFFSLASSMFWFTYLFYPDTTVWEIGCPLFLQGVSIGFIFTRLVFYLIGSVHPTLSSNASQAGTAIRFWSTTIGFSLMQNYMLYATHKYQDLLTKNLDMSSPIFQQEWQALISKFSAVHLPNEAVRLAAASLYKRLNQEALLVANMELFRGLAIFGCLMAFIILVARPIKNKFFHK